MTWQLRLWSDNTLGCVIIIIIIFVLVWGFFLRLGKRNKNSKDKNKKMPKDKKKSWTIFSPCKGLLMKTKEPYQDGALWVSSQEQCPKGQTLRYPFSYYPRVWISLSVCHSSSIKKHQEAKARERESYHHSYHNSQTLSPPQALWIWISIK